MKQMYAVVLGDDDGKSIDNDLVISIHYDNNTAKELALEVGKMKGLKCYQCEVMVDIVRVGDDG